jgi:hypothetical protein
LSLHRQKRCVFAIFFPYQWWVLFKFWFLFFFFLPVHFFVEDMVKLCKNTIFLSSCMLSLTLACWMESKNPKDNTDYILKTQIRRIFQLFV